MKLEAQLLANLAAIPLELEHVRGTLAAGLAESVEGNRLTGARPVVAGRPLVWGGSGRLVGWSLRATGGPVTVTLRDSHDATGDIVAVVNIADATSQSFGVPGAGVSFGEALNATASGAGVLEGAWWLGAVD